MPSEIDWESQYQKPRKITIWAQGRNKEFDKEFAYLALYCTSQVTVEVIVNFNTMEKALGKKKYEKEVEEQQADGEIRKVKLYLLISIETFDWRSGKVTQQNVKESK